MLMVRNHGLWCIASVQLFSIQIITVQDEMYVYAQLTRTHCKWLYVPFEDQATAFIVSENMDNELLRTINNVIDNNMEEIIAIQVTILLHFRARV